MGVAVYTRRAIHVAQVLVDELGALYVAGDNAHGQLGTGQRGDGTHKYLPVRVRMPRVSTAAAGCTFTLALTPSGGVFSWGSNRNGQLGQGDYLDRQVPKRITFFERLSGSVVQVAAGCHHALARTDGGEVYAWGWNAQGQLGLADRASHPMPRRVFTLEGAVAAEVAAGERFSLVRLADGRVYAFGDNSHGELGIGASQVAVPSTAGRAHLPPLGTPPLLRALDSPPSSRGSPTTR